MAKQRIVTINQIAYSHRTFNILNF